MGKQLVTEVVTFRLKPGVDEADFLRAADDVMPDLQSMSGYIDRELLKGEQGEWIDIVHWESMDHALAAAQAIMSAPNAGPFMAMIDETNTTMHHLEQVRVYRAS